MRRSMALVFVLVLGLVLLQACASSSSRTSSSPSSRRSGPFQAQYVPGLAKPEVSIVNKADRVINISLKGTESQDLSISPGTSETVSLPAGTYTYEAKASNVLPASGDQTFEKNHRYTWTFSIR